MADPTPVPQRLDSWKAIADYLKRDIGTVRRWEKTLGLPVRRVPGGRGRSVFAYTSEIDAWLQTEPSVASGPVAPERISRNRMAAAAALIAGVIAVLWWTRTPPLTVRGLQVKASGDGIVALDSVGMERWRYRFPSEYGTQLLRSGQPLRMVSSDPPAVYVATSHRVRRQDDAVESGALIELDLEGKLHKSFSFDDEVVFDGTKYGSPWAITTFAIDETGGARRVAVAAHHWLWDPSVVTVLDDQWQRRGTFVHAGWIEQVQWMPSNRLLVGGFSQSRDGGMVALLDAAALDGQGPEPRGARYYCETCGKNTPLRMVVMPRTEVNRVTVSRFNRAVVEITSDRIIARTIEALPDESQGAADVLYEFTPSLDLLNASFGARYWDIHRALEMQGKLAHTREQCPDRDGPREIRIWEPQTGWSVRRIR